ncbi:MAG: stage 0 sporulation family protein [Oscillospiraceae bacterium]|nr:stage 0 sporulation family protein [Oscillospiraceae bacterium]MBQ9959665.1 stage 0 sporulation family protein [Oscillospiraceae bacterium]
MAIVMGIRFRGAGKSYYFDPGEEQYKKGERVIVETARGLEMGEVSFAPQAVSDELLREPLKPVVRRADEEDLRMFEENCQKEKHAYQVGLEKIAARELDMSLVDAQYTFDGKKLTFYFTADDRVDFRELVKDLAGVFHTRIELRQIGVRDESRMLGGVGICGQEFCCCRFLPDFQPVSIKMAKEQGKSLSPTKISGVCGRLMCCLKYEQDMYEDLTRLTPPVGSRVRTPDGRGVVVEANVLMSTVKVRMDENDAIKPFASSQLRRLPGGKARKNGAGSAVPEAEE